MSSPGIERRTPTMTDSSGERMTERLHVTGKGLTLAAVLAELDRHDVPADVEVHQFFVSWVRPSTDAEKQRHADYERRTAERLEKWERETLARLTEKYR